MGGYVGTVQANQPCILPVTKQKVCITTPHRSTIVPAEEQRAVGGGEGSEQRGMARMSATAAA
jgi:hypothetical protein